MRHWQPVRAIYKIASSTARKLVSRGRPNALRAGMEGSITAHSASVRSLAYRCPARSYFGRVISVHMLYLGDCSTQLLCYNHLKSLNSFPVSLFRYPHSQQGLRAVGAAAQLLHDPFQPLLSTPGLNLLKRDAIDARRTAVRTAVSIGFFNDVRSTDLVPERIEAESRFSLSFCL